MTTDNKTYLDLSLPERFSLVQALQARRALVRENASNKQAKKKKGASKKASKPKKFAFDDPSMQAMFDMMPAEFKKKFGVKS